jgi:site-specific DNA-methyltransferase (adenine-specific)
MPRLRQYPDNAAKQAAYRQRQRAGFLATVPQEQIGDCLLYQGDARQLLPLLTGVDVILSDPPYGEKTRKGARGGGRKQTQLVTFAAMTEREAITLAKQCCVTARRWVVLFIDWRHAAVVEKACPVECLRVGWWRKTNGNPQQTGDRPGVGWESVVFLHREGRKHWNGGGHHAFWDVPDIPVEHGGHPTQKPLVLLRDQVRKFSDAGELVCDPFMGSGTTGVACVEQGRRFIGIEQKPEFFRMACARIATATRQGPLFVPRGAPTQEVLL